MKNFNLQCIKAARKYLEFRGWEILDTCPFEKIDLIVLDNFNELHFIRVKGHNRMPQEKDKNFSSKLRTKMEVGIFNFLETHEEYIDTPIHIDLIILNAVNSGDRALLTYVKDCANQ